MNDHSSDGTPSAPISVKLLTVSLRPSPVHPDPSPVRPDCVPEVVRDFDVVACPTEPKTREGTGKGPETEVYNRLRLPHRYSTLISGSS